MRLAVLGVLCMLVAVVGMVWGLIDQAREIRDMRKECENARRIIALLTETRQCERDEERHVREWLA